MANLQQAIANLHNTDSYAIPRGSHAWRRKLVCACGYACVHVYMRAYVCVWCTYACTRGGVHVFVCMQMCMRACVCECMRACSVLEKFRAVVKGSEKEQSGRKASEDCRTGPQSIWWNETWSQTKGVRLGLAQQLRIHLGLTGSRDLTK